MPRHAQLTPPSYSLEFQPEVLPSAGQGGPQRPALPPHLSQETPKQAMGLDPSQPQRVLWFFEGLRRPCLSPKWEASQGQGARAGHEVEQADLVDGELRVPQSAPTPRRYTDQAWGAQTDTWMPHQKIYRPGALEPQNHRFPGRGQRPRVSDSSALPPSHETSQPTLAWVPVSAPSPEEGAQGCREKFTPAPKQPGQASLQPGGAVKPFPP